MTEKDLEDLNAIVATFGPSCDGKMYNLGKSTPPIDQTKAIVLIAKILNEMICND